MTKDNIVDVFSSKYRQWPYSNTGILLVSLLIIYFFADSPSVQSFISSMGSIGYFGAFLAGIFFVSTFTVAPASVILFDIARTFDPFFVAILAGSGAVIGDYIIFRFLKDKIFEELSPVFDKLGGSLLKNLFMTPYFAWLIPIFGALVIASPMPDEVGISLMGISKVKGWQFLLVTFALNSIGIFVLVSLANNFF